MSPENRLLAYKRINTRLQLFIQMFSNMLKDHKSPKRLSYRKKKLKCQKFENEKSLSNGDDDDDDDTPIVVAVVTSGSI